MNEPIENLINEPIENLINEYMKKLKDDYLKKEEKAKEIIDFLNINFSKYISSISYSSDDRHVLIYFKDCSLPYNLPYQITFFKIQDVDQGDKFVYQFEGGKSVVNTIEELIPDICNIISIFKFRNEFKNSNKPDESKKTWWKFWA